MKGLKQAKVLRAMLRLGSFTRKELANATGESVEAINGIVARQMQFLRVVERVPHTGVGAPEELLAVRLEAQNDLLKELRLAYPELTTEENLAEYVPAAREFRVAVELLASLEGKPQLTVSDCRQVLALLATASEKEGVETTGDLEKDLARDVSSLTRRQLLAKAHIDFRRGQLCWLSFPAFLAGEVGLAAGSNPLSLGLKHFEAAERTFGQHAAGTALPEMDRWVRDRLFPAALHWLASPNPRLMDILARRAVEARSSALRGIDSWFGLLSEQLRAQRTFQFIPVASMASGVTPLRPVQTVVVEMGPFGDSWELEQATLQPFSADQPVGTQIVVDASKALEGLVSSYCINYRPSCKDLASLVHFDRDFMQVAIMKGELPRCSYSVDLKQESAEVPVQGRAGKGSSTGAAEQTGQYLVEALKKLLRSCEETVREAQVEAIYVSGDPLYSRAFMKAAAPSVCKRVERLDPVRVLRVNRARCQLDQLKASEWAVEIGLAAKQCRVPVSPSGLKFFSTTNPPSQL